MVLNSRPLTYVSADDFEDPLTPSHLLTGRRLLSYPDYLVSCHEDDYEVVAQQYSSRYHQLNKFLDTFWERWRKDYYWLHEVHRHYCFVVVWTCSSLL